MKQISVIIPTYNEEGNIRLLIEKLHNAFSEYGVVYEIIFIDDHSTDKTRDVINEFVNDYPVFLYMKEGIKGKAQSIIEGSRKARYELIGMIDGDLQYPPEAFPFMVDKIINEKTDIVVGKRDEGKTSIKRKFFSKGFLWFFGKLLHGLSCDVQSGMKVFKKEITQRLILSPKPWTFDLEFLVKAREAGYKIGDHNIVFNERIYGKSKVNVIKTSIEIGFEAIKLLFRDFEIFPFHSKTAEKIGNGFHYKGKKFFHYSNLNHKESAFFTVSNHQKFFLFSAFLLVVIGFILNWHNTIIAIIMFLTGLYFLDLVFNFFLIYKGFSKKPEIKIKDGELSEIKDENWPSYTILCPLYKEWQVVGQFVTSITRLDYPKDKLQVILLLEEDDKETTLNIGNYSLPPYFKIVIVPDSFPKTKPKALNYGLKKAQGEYIVVYDAEDVPEQRQLKKAVLAFKKAGKKTVCIQAKLNFYNPHQNLLTKIFTAEYSLWFDLVLTGLQSIVAPIPLGGTSNHFKTENLKSLNGWDAFNVTEDCDLGMRLIKRGYKTAIIDSITLEEANADLRNWFNQRTRWVKGYIQTYFVHMRDPKGFINKYKKENLLIFQLVVGGKILSMLINPLMWVITFAYFAFRSDLGLFIQSFFPGPVLYLGVLSLVIGNFLYLYYYMIGLAKRGQFNLIKFVYMVPFYWLIMSMAAWFAAYKAFTEPHYWPKTVHGFHLKEKRIVDQVKSAIGKELVDPRLASSSIPVYFSKRL